MENLYAVVMMEELPTEEAFKSGSFSKFVPGIFEQYENAEYHILSNSKNIHEHIYTYALIEEVSIDEIYPQSKVLFWYKFDKEKEAYHEIHDVETYFCNFSIG